MAEDSQDSARSSLWLPVLLGVGILGWFWPPAPPPLWVGGTLGVLAAALAFWGRRRDEARFLGVAGGMVAAGMMLAALEAWSVESPMLTRALSWSRVEGRVVLVEPMSVGFRMLLDEVVLSRLPPDRTPQRVRITMRWRGVSPPRPGTRIKLPAGLMPPPAPVLPGGFDFRRRAWYAGLGAVGYARGRFEILEQPPVSGPWSRSWWHGLRLDIAQRLMADLPGRLGTLAAALMTGLRKAVPEEVLTAFRDAGIMHLLAISGLHMGLVTGFLFATIRAGLARVESLALNYPVKKWAAVAALAGGFVYLQLAGASVPTQRAFIMAGLAFTAILFDRTPLSMRLVAWAAAVILVLAPHTVLTAGFQLSFSAVIALVAVYESLSAWLHRRHGENGPVQRLRTYLLGLVLSAVVAGLTTGPIAAFHFHTLPQYGMLVNLAAVPLTAFWIMPFGLIALILMPINLHVWPLTAMGWGLDLLLRLAETVAARPQAVLLLPPPPPVVLGLVMGGGLWLAIRRDRWRWGGSLPVALGLLGFLAADPPDIVIDRDGRVLGVRQGDALLLSTRRRGAYAARKWQQSLGLRHRESWPEEGVLGDLACDGLGCRLTRAGHSVILLRHPFAWQEDCHLADLIIAGQDTAPPGCRAQTIDRRQLRRYGAHAVWLRPGKITVAGTDHGCRRPWCRQPKRGESPTPRS